MDPKFVYFIKLNSYIVVSMIVIHVRDVVQRQSGHQYPLAEWLELRNHPLVEDVFNRYWKFAEFTHLLGVLLEIDHFLIPIGFIFGLEVLTVAAGDVIWNDVGENYKFLLALIIWFVYFYYIMYILRKLFRARNCNVSGSESPANAIRRIMKELTQNSKDRTASRDPESDAGNPLVKV
ncbi:uncharacterized protein LOC4576318 isoform X1 [Anopheles gambiae]|uniref:uncharacterized protein LOC4576318 isoform X1 n=1 Tax=Anopheles gambiae TaxID=7165 RepID=UPI002AC9A13A|nr:uncharacterized protein LOC4576318 isoform X1 [Anopheles gambiae]